MIFITDIKITDAELKVLRAIWELGDQCKLEEIRLFLNKEENQWKTTTLCTMLTRLEKKAAITKEKQGVYLYTALIDRDEYVQDEMKKVRKLMGGNTKGLMAALCSADDLSIDEFEELDAIWQKKRQELMNE